MTYCNDNNTIELEKKDLLYVYNLVSKLKDECFTGNIQINFRLGGISNINKLESIRSEDF